MDIKDVFLQHSLITMEKTYRLAVLTNSSDWQLDFETAEIEFENGMRFPVQFIATESFESQTWLWSDENANMDFPANSLGLVRSIRRKGTRELFADKIEITENGYDSACLVVAADLFGNPSASYACDHEQGKVHIAIFDDQIATQPDLDFNMLRECVMNLVPFNVDLIALVATYFKLKKYSLQTDWESEVRCILSSGESFGLFVRTNNAGETELRVEGAMG